MIVPSPAHMTATAPATTAPSPVDIAAEVAPPPSKLRRKPHRPRSWMHETAGFDEETDPRRSA